MYDTAGLSVKYEYDAFNRQHKASYTAGGETVTQELVYGTGEDADKLVGFKQNGVQIKSYAYDELNRVTSETLNTTAPLTTTYGYVDHATEQGRTSALVETVQVGTKAQASSTIF